MNRPVVICGLGRVGWRVLEILQTANLNVVVVDNSCAPDDPRLGTARLLRGDCRRREILEQAGVTQARGVLILTSDDLINISTALTVRSIHPNVRIVLRMFNQNLIPRLGQAVYNVYALSTSVLTAPLLALTALTGQALSMFRLDDGPYGRRQVAEVTITPISPLRGQSVAGVAARYQVAVVAHLPAHATAKFLLDVKPEAALAAGDRLVVCGAPHDLEELSVQGSKTEVDVLWASWFRRNARVLGRTLTEIELPVKICTIVLLVVIVLSTLILHLGVKRYRLSVALFRTISLLATGSDMHEEDYDTDWLKVYVSSLRIAGAALTAAFIAIVTNYLLRARLGGALEIRRIPDRGHVIVCGVGNIGYRVIEELLACGERVAAIEVARDSRFVPTARRQGVPVIIGDATVREVLRQAHAATARAVIAATSHDLINLEVALLARDLNPHQRVVLRLSDPHLADMLRESANIQMALSVAVLSAPAFVASLFGDRVLSLCLVEGRLIAVVNLRIGAQDLSLAGASVRDTAALYRLLPLAVITAEGTHQPLNVALKPGDQLIGFIALADMERLLRRETA